MLEGSLLAGSLNIKKALELKQALLERLEEGPGSLTFDFSAVTSVDTAIAQLLLAFKLRQPAMTIIKCSDEVIEQFSRLGMMRYLL